MAGEHARLHEGELREAKFLVQQRVREFLLLALLSSAALWTIAPISVRGDVRTSFLTHPDIHGDQVVFTCEGDLWLGSVRRSFGGTGNGMATNAISMPSARERHRRRRANSEIATNALIWKAK